MDFRVTREEKLSFSTAATGEIGIAAKYALSMGSNFNSLARGRPRNRLCGNRRGQGQRRGQFHQNGFDTDTPLGGFSCGDKVELGATRTVKFTCASISNIALAEAFGLYAKVVMGAVAAQNAVFLAWEAALADKANMTLDEYARPDDMDVEDTHNFRTEFHKGPDIDNAAVSLSAITTCAGIVLAAYQMVACEVPTTAPTIEMDPFGITISCGPASKITLDPFGIQTIGLTNTQRAASVSVQSPLTSIGP